MEFRDYQPPAIRALVTTRRGILKAPAGSGKTVIGAGALHDWAGPRYRLGGRRRLRVAWIANTIEQCDQARKAMALFPRLVDYLDVKVACYASGMSLADRELVLLDECHHVPAEEYRKMLDGQKGWRWGLSATPERADALADDLYELIGPIIHEVPRAALVEAGQLAKAKVIIHAPNKPKEYEKLVKDAATLEYDRRRARYGRSPMWNDEEQWNRCVWQEAQEIGIVQNRARNELTIKLAREHAEDSTLIIIGKIEHGEALVKEIRGAVLVHSKMRKRDAGMSRAEALDAFKAGAIKTVIATSLADEGLDVPRASVLILVAGGRSNAKAEQRTGRVLRAFDGKSHGVIHDFMDVQHYFLRAQSSRRMALYRKLGYMVSFAGEEAFL